MTIENFENNLRLASQMTPQEFDPRFRVEVIAQTPLPQTVVFSALHQDYFPGMVFDEQMPSETKAGKIAVERCLNKHHYGILEHPQITFNVGGFPHSVMVQARTHRVGISFDVCSGRYVSNQYLSVFEHDGLSVEDVIYFRPVGRFRDRAGKDYEYTEIQREADKLIALSLLRNYRDKINQGFSEEHARDMLPYGVRQTFIVSMNLRTLCHFLDLRHKADAQIEIQMLSRLLVPHFKVWCPEIAQWYLDKRLSKGVTSP